MGQQYHLYYEALDANKGAFEHGLWTKAYQSLSTALHYALVIGSPRRLVKVERLAQEQLEKVKEDFNLELSPLEPDEVTNYQTLIELAATYYELIKSEDARVVTNSSLDGHKFENTTTIDADSGIPVSSYAIDGVPVEPHVWDTKYITAQQHEKNPTSSQNWLIP